MQPTDQKFTTPFPRCSFGSIPGTQLQEEETRHPFPQAPLPPPSLGSVSEEGVRDGGWDAQPLPRSLCPASGCPQDAEGSGREPPGH